MQIEVVVDAGAIIGESPTWAAAEQALYWIDVKKPALYRFDPATGGQRVWPVPSDIGAFALVVDPPAAVVALRNGIFELDLASGGLTFLAPPPFDPTLFRFNEGGCDVAGRFWLGVMFDPVVIGAPPQKSSLHSFTFEHGLRPEPDAAELHNGMAWSADNRTFYLTHSFRQRILAYSFDPGLGRLGQPIIFSEARRPARRCCHRRRGRLLVCASRWWSAAALCANWRNRPGYPVAGQPADHVRFRRTGS